ncbi:uncharacterized protein LOC133388926 [Rhineura floridana]|uniref:uncharacterized protein LOC133388926 n=1 Tax=Rhineura floridana TaxID=261503 RepID=UPI002AC85C75|nr:uncharacterized protein LOC133388926 [Rhineura floridana]
MMAEQPETIQATKPKQQPVTNQMTKPKPPKAVKHKHSKAVAKTKHLSHCTIKRPCYVSVLVPGESNHAQLTTLFHSHAASSDEDFPGFPVQPTVSQSGACSSSLPVGPSAVPPIQEQPSTSLGLQLSNKFITQLQGMLSFFAQSQSSSQVPAIHQRSGVQLVHSETNPSRSPDPFDVARGRFVDDVSFDGESAFALQDQGDEWSDYSEPEQDTSYRLFGASDYQPLVRRVLNTLGLQSTPTVASAPALKGARVLKSPTPAENFLPVPDPIAKLAKDEWSHPLQAHRFNIIADRLYPLAPDFSTRLAVPGIDKPISSLVSRSLLPREGDSHLKDATERRLDFALRKTHEAIAFSMRASTSASIFTRAAMMWLDDLIEDHNPDPASLRRSLLKLRKTAAFVADATLDANQLAARALAAQVVARRTLRLHHWQADSTPRVNLSRAPYAGSLLFGEEALRAVLVDPKDTRKPVLATVKKSSTDPLDVSLHIARLSPFGERSPGDEAAISQHLISAQPEEAGIDVSSVEVSTRAAEATQRPHTGEGLANADNTNAIPVGGRLLLFAEHWLPLTQVPWIRALFCYGYAIEFWAILPNKFYPSPCPRALDRHCIMQTAIHHLLDIEAIEPVPTAERSEGVYSLLFAVPKRDLSWRAVLNLKFINRFVKYRRFKMESLHSITDSLQEGDFLASIDLKEAYLRVPICIDHRKFLRFAFGSQHFQYRAMPFGLSSAPRVFTKVLLTLVAYLRLQGVHIYPYLDDLLIRARSRELTHRHLTLTLHVLQDHGWLVFPPFLRTPFCLPLPSRLLLSSQLQCQGGGLSIAGALVGRAKPLNQPSQYDLLTPILLLASATLSTALS